MGNTTITISSEAYRILRAQKRDGESFSDLILRTFSVGRPARILASIRDLEPLDDEAANAILKASKDLRKNLRIRRKGSNEPTT